MASNHYFSSDYKLREVASSAAHELSPVCAMIGGLLGQDILKYLSGREAPIANFLALDGTTGQATASRLAM
jgi:ubiquitin-like 1-activating enzyme E1 A